MTKKVLISLLVLFSVTAQAYSLERYQYDFIREHHCTVDTTTMLPCGQIYTTYSCDAGWDIVTGNDNYEAPTRCYVPPLRNRYRAGGYHQ